MTKLTITLDVDNAAFFDPHTKAHNWEKEASLIIRQLADRIYGSRRAAYPFRLHDAIGNNVGSVILSTDS